MRIIAGSAKRRQLKAPKGWNGRPTADRVKESLFNILGDLVVDSNFLDLFAGTGNIGMEALSRGARRVVFIENDSRAAKAMVNTIHDFGLEVGSSVIEKDVYHALDSLGRDNSIGFDIVFLDPPYGLGFEVPVIQKIAELQLMAPGGIIIAESSKREDLPSEITGFPLIRQSRYGDTLLSFYQQKG